jgi:hypothetical protein
MRAKVYLETTIPSYLVARPSRDILIAAHQQITQTPGRCRTHRVCDRVRVRLLADLELPAYRQRGDSAGLPGLGTAALDLNCRPSARRKN